MTQLLSPQAEGRAAAPHSVISAPVSPWSSQNLILTLHHNYYWKDTQILFFSHLDLRNCPVLKLAVKLIADSWGREVAV